MINISKVPTILRQIDSRVFVFKVPSIGVETIGIGYRSEMAT